MLSVPYNFPLTVAQAAEASGISVTKIADSIRDGGLQAHDGKPYTTTPQWLAEWADNGKPQKGPWRRDVPETTKREMADRLDARREKRDRDRINKIRSKVKPGRKVKAVPKDVVFRPGSEICPVEGMGGHNSRIVPDLAVIEGGRDAAGDYAGGQ